MPNKSFGLVSKPPGKSILDPITELFYYMRYLIDNNRSGLIEELLAQFRDKNPTVAGILNQNFSDLFLTIVTAMNNK
jgi:hypothetical protein